MSSDGGAIVKLFIFTRFKQLYGVVHNGRIARKLGQPC